MPELKRYSVIDSHMKRELLLLQGTGCIWKKCKFCDYYNDTSIDPFVVNKPVIDRISGVYGVVDVINSGSFFEIDEQTKIYLRDKLSEKKIKTLWCESHWLYHSRLEEIRSFFQNTVVKFRIGIETFNSVIRDSWLKGIPKNITAELISKYFDGVCLLACVEGQTKESIINDIKTAMEYFSYFNINVFTENSTSLKSDKDLKEWFKTDVYPHLTECDNVEVLIENTDLGVG